jgi:DUF2975 family protein
MPRRAFLIGGWAALALGALVALAAAIVVVTGALALTGRVTYPVHADLGPFSINDEVSMPVSLSADVCQKADVFEQNTPSDCFRFFVHGDHRRDDGAVRTQDAEVRPTSATLYGTVDLATTSGWSGLVAASVARKAFGLLVISGVLLLLWRLLASSATGDVFSTRTVRYVRGIGGLLIVGSLGEMILGLVVDATSGYELESFGRGPHLDRMGQGGVGLTQLAVGALILLLAEAFRHGATVEAEQKLTV